MWKRTYAEMTDIIRSVEVDILYFRGHSNESWDLLPGLGRMKNRSKDFEEITYYDFVTRAGSLLPEGNSSWNNALSMQHHGMPTRFLDWTEHFAVALYFALKDAKGTACVWVLDPFSLNSESINEKSLLHPSEIVGDYESIFLKNSINLDGDVIALWPLRHHPRVFSQKAGFTLHGNLSQPLEDLHPEVLRKILIPEEDQEEARNFLKLAGVSEFSLFPDLDGLAREVRQEHSSEF